MMRHFKWMIACLVVFGLALWLVPPPPTKAVVTLFAGMCFGYHFAEWDRGESG